MRTDQNFLLYLGMYPARNESGDAGFLDARSLSVCSKKQRKKVLQKIASKLLNIGMTYKSGFEIFH